MKRTVTILLTVTLILMTIGCQSQVETGADGIRAEQPSQSETPILDSRTEALPLDQLPTYSFEVEDVYCTRGQNRIYGRMYIPQTDKKPMPTVIFSHGYGGSVSTGASYAEALAEKGVVVYCFEFCGGGGSRSDGSPLDMSVMTEKADLLAVLDMVKELDYVDNGRIVLMGSSQGGMVSAMAGAERPDDIRGLILLYPAFCIGENVHSRYSSLSEVPEEVAFFPWLTVGKAYVTDVWDYDVYADIGGYQGEVLLLHGSSDSTVDVSYSERAKDVYSSADLYVIGGAGHGFSGSSFDEAAGHIFDYLQKIGIWEAETQRRLKVSIGDTVGYIVLNDNTTAKAFLELLSLTTTMQDLHGREYWFSHSLPYDEQDVIHDYAPGQLTYWCGGWVTAYYDRDDDNVIEAGSVVIGVMDQILVDAFHGLNGRPESVTIELSE